MLRSAFVLVCSAWLGQVAQGRRFHLQDGDIEELQALDAATAVAAFLLSSESTVAFNPSSAVLRTPTVDTGFGFGHNNRLITMSEVKPGEPGYKRRQLKRWVTNADAKEQAEKLELVLSACVALHEDVHVMKRSQEDQDGLIQDMVDLQTDIKKMTKSQGKEYARCQEEHEERITALDSKLSKLVKSNAKLDKLYELAPAMEELTRVWKTSDAKANNLEKLAPTMKELSRFWKKSEYKDERRGRMEKYREDFHRGGDKDRDEKVKAKEKSDKGTSDKAARSDAKKSVRATPRKQGRMSAFFRRSAAALEASFLTPEEIARKRGQEMPGKSSSEKEEKAKQKSDDKSAKSSSEKEEKAKQKSDDNSAKSSSEKEGKAKQKSDDNSAKSSSEKEEKAKQKSDDNSAKLASKKKEKETAKGTEGKVGDEKKSKRAGLRAFFARSAADFASKLDKATTDKAKQKSDDKKKGQKSDKAAKLDEAPTDKEKQRSDDKDRETKSDKAKEKSDFKSDGKKKENKSDKTKDKSDDKESPIARSLAIAARARTITDVEQTMESSEKQKLDESPTDKAKQKSDDRAKQKSDIDVPSSSRDIDSDEEEEEITQELIERLEKESRKPYVPSWAVDSAATANKAPTDMAKKKSDDKKKETNTDKVKQTPDDKARQKSDSDVPSSSRNTDSDEEGDEVTQESIERWEKESRKPYVPSWAVDSAATANKAPTDMRKQDYVPSWLRDEYEEEEEEYQSPALLAVRAARKEKEAKQNAAKIKAVEELKARVAAKLKAAKEEEASEKNTKTA